MQGTHQLAKMLSRRGCPVARSRELSAGLPGSAARDRTPAPACRSIFDGTLPCRRRRQPPDQRRDHQSSSASGAKRTARLMRSAPAPFGARPRAGGARATAARAAPARRQIAISAPPSPDQGHERLPPQPQLPAARRIRLADHGVELAVPEGLDRRLVGLGRRVGEIAGLRLQDDLPRPRLRAARPRSLSSSCRLSE